MKEYLNLYDPTEITHLFNYRRHLFDPDKSDFQIIPIKKRPTLKYTGIGRNELCPCGSGKKFKKCCINEVQNDTQETTLDSVTQK